MARIATLRIALEVTGNDGTTELAFEPAPFRFTSTVLQRQTLALANGANTITPPTGAKFVLLDLGSAVSLTLEGIAADTGIALTPSTAPLGIPGLLPLASVASFVITNGNASSQNVPALWL